MDNNKKVPLLAPNVFADGCAYTSRHSVFPETFNINRRIFEHLKGKRSSFIRLAYDAELDATIRPDEKLSMLAAMYSGRPKLWLHVVGTVNYQTNYPVFRSTPFAPFFETVTVGKTVIARNSSEEEVQILLAEFRKRHGIDAEETRNFFSRFLPETDKVMAADLQQQQDNSVN
jgi:hypothetical protein